MSTTLSLRVILLILNITNVFIHAWGTYALLSVYKNSRHKPQRVYLINLSLCELLLNLLEAIRNIPELLSPSSQGNLVTNQLSHYILIISFTGISFVYYLDMIFLTIDRLAKIILSLDYPQYWNEKKAMLLLLGTWLVGATLCLFVSLFCAFVGFHWKDFFFKYFYPTLEFLFLIIALLTYIMIFNKFNKTSKNLSLSATRIASPLKITRTQPPGESLSKFKRFRDSFFFLPSLLVSTFILFMIVPDLVYLFIGIIHGNATDVLKNACWISYAISNLIDAVLYIFLLKDVRCFLLKRIICYQCERFRIFRWTGKKRRVKRSPIVHSFDENNSRTGLKGSGDDSENRIALK